VKRFKVFCSLLCIACGIGWVLFFGLSQPLPTQENPLIFYSNQSKNDLHKLFVSAISEAKKSLHLSIYALTDPYLISLLRQKTQEGVKTKIFYDPTATDSLPVDLEAYPVKLSGALMHRKILIADEEKVFLGSSNLTTSSLKMHDNLVAGMFHPNLAQFLLKEDSSNFTGKDCELWLLPSEAALERLLTILGAAKKQIHVAMFTLTHPILVKALIEAHQRGVDVRVAVDHYTAEGASLQTLEILKKAEIPLFLSQGTQLFHHKWALVDQTLVLGSANWTKAAFTNNQDCFIIFESLSKKHKTQIKNIWKIIELESN
jgi:cardiolipin synthase